jgi:glyoxylase-like metal-dependent hydrolase (beta-lactamase superfamily II)
MNPVSSWRPDPDGVPVAFPGGPAPADSSGLDRAVGVVEQLTPLVRRILAPNPSVMTGAGTNTYLVGTDQLAIIDPGPDDPDHLAAILDAVGDARIRSILITHTHPDHWPAAVPLAARTGAEILGFASRDGLELSRRLGNGSMIQAHDFRLRAVHTPGHADNHLCFLLREEQLLFTGDHVMHGSTVVIYPPEGDMTAYLASLEKLLAIKPPLLALAPGHGELFEDPESVLRGIIEHRLAREAKVVSALAAAAGPVTVDVLLPSVYDDVEERRLVIARGSLWAHLRKLVDDGRATTTGYDDLDAGTWTAA